ncbi:gamma-glutamyltransferase [Mitsuaria sp. GD03876]|uniref:gamma-glutamyltransferase n=1 Tax=Mitsuaria sp. GD03876 TaxID=2975399 RepID=UPI00244A8F2A|nr:gamma-glutamyltransferase [Mitsuaria sp. GD03876]MDH0866511.1 gamma-glutamyltransferase [Mitsuaria sp. GD03876]
MLTPELVDELTSRAVFGRKSKVTGRRGVIVSSHPVVSRVGADVLREGGSAVDAVLAAAVAQTVIEPHMGTIFGMLSLLHHDAASGRTEYMNGSLNAPLAGLPGFSAADIGTGRSVAVPGFWAGFEAAAKRFGRLDRARLLAPAIQLARDGFPIYPFLYGVMFEQAGRIGLGAEGRETYFPGGALAGPGHRLKQPRLADTLAALADGGEDYFYRSAFTRKVVDTVKAAGGVLTMEDFDRFAVRWQEPAWGSYKGHRIAGSPPPDNGGTHLIEILQLLEQLPLSQWGAPHESADTMYWLARCCTEVFNEGGRQRDPETFPVPLDLITSKAYAQQRLELMKMSLPNTFSATGAPYPGSNHLTVVDERGNIATVLHSVMSMPWSNGLIVDGVNIWAGGVHFMRQMPKPGGRGSVYVAPHLVFDDAGKPLLAGGSPSASLIPACVSNILNIVEYGLDIEASVHQPRVGGPSLAAMLMPGNLSTTIEVDCGNEALRADVLARGLPLETCSPWNFMLGSYDGIHFTKDGAQACADPRRAGGAEAV